MPGPHDIQHAVKTFLIVLFLCVTLACNILSKVLPHYSVPLGIIGGLSGLAGIVSAIKRGQNTKPYEKEFFRDDWVREEGEIPQHHIRIPSEVHKKGKHPQVEFFKTRSPHTSTALVYDTEPDGTVVIRNEPSSTMFQFKEFKVKVR